MAMNNVLRFIFEARDEVNKIVWPSRDQTIRYTILVIIVAVMVGVLLGGLDYVLTLLTARIVNN